MALGPTYGQPFFINESGVINASKEVLSSNLSALVQSGVSADAANWDGANNVALAANSANSAGNNNLPTALGQAGWLLAGKTTAGNNIYVPYWI